MGALGLQIVDRDLGDERRSTRSLSGGERFLASLALALALAGLEGRNSFVDTLFIDEGFGALDAMTLDVAIDALENLQGQGRKVGVISHVESLQESHRHEDLRGTARRRRERRAVAAVGSDIGKADDATSALWLALRRRHSWSEVFHRFQSNEKARGQQQPGDEIACAGEDVEGRATARKFA